MSDIGVGLLVACVDDDFTPETVARGTVLPVRGKIYTVRRVRGPRPPYRDKTCYFLAEIVNKPVRWSGGFGEPQFRFDRFRPIRDDAIDVFRKIAAPADDTVLA
jgi:hypothetical protein